MHPAFETGSGFSGLCFGQNRTPGDNIHVERNGVAGHTRANATETEDAERFAGEAFADSHAALEAVGMAREAAMSRPSASSIVA